MGMRPLRLLLSMFIIISCQLFKGHRCYDDDTNPSGSHSSSSRNIVSSQNYTYLQPHSHGSSLLEARLSSRSRTTRTYIESVNVDDYSSEGDDDTEAFEKAWKVACSSEKGADIEVPSNKIYHLKPIIFSGPCKSDVTIKICGKIRASVNQSEYEKDRRHWLSFQNMENLSVRGGCGGSITGNGQRWWKTSCKIDKSLPCKEAPTAVTFKDCKNLEVSDLAIRNAQKMHLSFQECQNVKATNIRVRSPSDSPNTDGIHVTQSQNVLITNSVIRTGDDCISIVNGSRNVQVTNIECGPGHGISIGSLGADNSENFVSAVIVSGAKLSGATNGVRIKTWQGGSGYAKNITFQDITMRNVTNPIIIDQNYCDQDQPCSEQESAVKVSNVVYRDIKGTSASEIAVKFDCSKTHPCEGIILEDIDLRSQSNGGAKASCSNVELEEKGKVFPTCT